MLMLILAAQCVAAIRLQPAVRRTSLPIRSVAVASEANPPEEASTSAVEDEQEDENAFREKYIQSLTDENGVNTLVCCRVVAACATHDLYSRTTPFTRVADWAED